MLARSGLTDQIGRERIHRDLATKTAKEA
jgi:hypothetical protein